MIVVKSTVGHVSQYVPVDNVNILNEAMQNDRVISFYYRYLHPKKDGTTSRKCLVKPLFYHAGKDTVQITAYDLDQEGLRCFAVSKMHLVRFSEERKGTLEELAY